MERKLLEELVLQGVALREIASRLGVSISTVRYWIAKHELPRPREIRARLVADRLTSGDTRRRGMCSRHGEVELVMDRRGSWRCPRCRRGAVAERRRRVKRILVAEAGGRCLICGYDSTVAALQFHHIDPTTKSFGLAAKGHTVGIDRARDEAAKCALLCANCHIEVEVGIAALPDSIRLSDSA